MSTGLKPYQIKSAICVSFDGAKDAEGKSMSGIQSAGTIMLDPEHSATESWLKNKAIVPKGVVAKAKAKAKASSKPKE